ncbi:MAG: glycosyltransferase family 4 protein [Acidobacteria bacterium]|nr:glycosyltransferase family 4 protein [Acidobacteriota bacterium]MCA1611856.1 glycosyltransferase family 4 protein [Acidobacteriota bacterium]
MAGPTEWPAAQRVARAVFSRFPGIHAAYRRLRGRPGVVRYAATPAAPVSKPFLELRVRAEGPAPVTRAEAAAWCGAQTLAELRGVGYGDSGEVAWTTEAQTAPGPAAAGASPWFFAPRGLPDVSPSFLESASLVLAAEQIDALALPAGPSPNAAEHTVHRSGAYELMPSEGNVRALTDALTGKTVARRAPLSGGKAFAYRRDAYVSTRPMGEIFSVGLRDARAVLRRAASPSGKPAVLVLTSYLARGGVEEVLYQVLSRLTSRFEFLIVTLAPHEERLGDRRADFAKLTPRLYGFGDLVHPDAMFGMLGALIDASAPVALYNANGTTWFYDVAPELKRQFPGLRLIDQLYDHRAGYIDRYDERIRGAIDVCVATNGRIARALIDKRGWPEARTPVIRPCVAPPEPVPPGEQRSRRAALRAVLGAREDTVVFLLAARMHPQKRPLDLVRVAGRVRDLAQLRFVLVGGGVLEQEVDREIAALAGENVVRLPFRRDVPALVAAADVGCLVSDYEGLPVFLLEALSSGVPFLGTDVGEMGELLKASGAGVVVDRPGDLDAIEAAVRRLADRDFRSSLAARTREAARAFDAPACAEKYAGVFLT